jgi:predicted HTH domain antitoxin
MSVLSLRLNTQESRHILVWAKQGKKDKSQAARELLEYGWKFALLEQYRQGKISLGLAAKEMGVSVLEAMDFLAEHSASTQLDYGDYLQSLENVREAF